MSIGILELTFTPSEVEKITGMSTAKQRDLRRHGFIPDREGHARFNAYDLAELLFVQRMSERGVGPKQAFEVSATCATGIVWHALSYVEAYRGDHLTLIDKGIVPEVIWDEEQIELVEAIALQAENFGKTADEVRRAVTKRSAEYSSQAGFLQQYIVGQTRGRVLPAPYFIWWADNSEEWAHNLQDAFDQVRESDSKRTGPVIVLSLESLGKELLELARQPFFEVRVN